jgi:rubrerythrin
MEGDIKGFVKAEDVDFSDEKAVLKAALENEIKGRELYVQYANTVKSVMAKNVFAHLANEELTHIEDIKAFLKSESMGTDIDVEAMTRADAAEEAKTLFGRLVGEMKERVTPSDDDNKARDVAMELERNGYEYYKKGAEATKNPELKKFLEWLVEQEQAHFMFIRNAFEYMNDPASWHAGEEGWLLEG